MLFNQSTLAKVAAAQLEQSILAFSFNEQADLLPRLRAIYARKVAQIKAYANLMAETVPDLVLRTADGREMVLRLPSDEMVDLCHTLYGKLADEVRRLEESIVEEALEVTRGTYNQPVSDDLRPAILAICQGQAQPQPSGQ